MLNTQGVILEYKNVTGETLTYKTVMDTTQKMTEGGKTAEAGQVHVEMFLTQKTTKVDGNTADVEMCITGGYVERNAERSDLPTAGQKIDMVMDKSGKILRSSLDTSMSQPTFPKGALQVGQTWDEKSTMQIPLGEPGKTKELTLEYHYKLAALTHEEGYEVAVIEANAGPETCELQEGVTQTIRVEGRTLFAYQAGRLVSSKVRTHTVVKAPDLNVETDHVIHISLDKVDSPLLETPSLVEESYIIWM